MRVLVVSDAPNATDALRGSFGYVVSERALDGTSALQMVRQARDDGSPYDVVCVALALRDMDGYLMLKCLRTLEQQAGAHRQTPVWMFTSTDAGRDVVRTRRRRFDAHLHLTDGQLTYAQLTRSWSKYSRISAGVQSTHCA